MRLIGFKIQNVKSILDTGWCHLSDTDNITVFAGQNEAGKSAILEALNLFRNGTTPEFERLSIRSDGKQPYVECEFHLEEADWQSDDEDVNAILGKFDSVKFFRGNPEKFDCAEIKLLQETVDRISAAVETYAIKKNAQTTKHMAKELVHPNPELIEEGVQEPVATLSADHLPPQADPEELKGVISAYLIDELLPEFIYYNSFSDYLPGTIKISEITTNSAVKDFQQVFNVNLAEIAAKTTQARSSAVLTLNNRATMDLNTYWKQKQSTATDDNYTYQINVLPNADPALSAVEFLIHRNDGMPLFIEQKSKGFQWFSSFNLRLKALGVDAAKAHKYLILIDEPGQGLHETAQLDVKSVLEELADKGMQNTYSTHNPCLIGVKDHEILRIRLVYQTRDDGTKIKNIAQFSSSDAGSKDALSPIISAMGINSVGQLLDRAIPSIALEGITDHYYFSALKQLLGVTQNYNFIPAVGVQNIRPLVSVLIGWGADFKAVFDDGEGKKLYKELGKFLYSGDEVELKKHVYKMDGFDGVEDLFTPGDFDTYVVGAACTDVVIKNSVLAKTKKKELLARVFLEKVKTDSASIKLSLETKRNFKKIFDWLNS